MKFLKIAVTGSAGSGKSLVCKAFFDKGFATMDCDAIARQVVEPGTKGLEKTVQLFGADALQADGTLDRVQLRKLIVNDRSLKKKLENILHPLILEEVLDGMQTAQDKGFPAVAVEVPLLFESGMDQYFDVTIAVLAEDPELVGRISRRDQVSEQDAQKMLALQMPQDEKARRSDYVIKNTGSPSELVESVENLVNKIQKEFLTR